MRTEIVSSLNSIDPQHWDLMVAGKTPFMRYDFLSLLQQTGCDQRWGWFPQHLLLRDDNDELIGAMPMYLKNNSYGEFVFDWAWADAYHRSGLDYYPKLVVAVPYTPVSGPRLLRHPHSHYSDETIVKALMDAAIGSSQVSSVHILFPEQQMQKQLLHYGLLPRLGCQFHWHNRHDKPYADFDDFLGELSSRKRKNIRKERQSVKNSTIRIRRLSGHEISSQQWLDFHRHYTSTFERLGGHATLSLDFFQSVGQTMPAETLLIQAFDGERAVASAFCMRDDQTLYGRHWGCDDSYHNLHFELCYYQGIDYCIEQQLLKFEPGAQGEHKISRGFLPSLTYSAHWIADSRFQQLIAEFLQRESEGIKHYQKSLMSHSPFKQ